VDIILDSNSIYHFTASTDNSLNSIATIGVTNNKLLMVVEKELYENKTTVTYTDPGKGVLGRLISINNIPVANFTTELNMISPTIDNVTLDVNGNIVLNFTKEISTKQKINYTKFIFTKNQNNRWGYYW
jgi:hypothetical protein